MINKNINLVKSLFLLANVNVDSLDNYVDSKLKEEFDLNIDNRFDDFFKELKEKLTEDDINALAVCSEKSFDKLNELLNNTTKNEKNKEIKIAKLHFLRRAVLKAPVFPTNLKLYRYISANLKEVKELKDDYVFIPKFINKLNSEDKVFKNRNEKVKLEILVPANSEDLIIDVNTEDNSFIVNSLSIFKVLDVITGREPKVTLMLIPQKVWNERDYIEERNQ